MLSNMELLKIAREAAGMRGRDSVVALRVFHQLAIGSSHIMAHVT
jgi:hypothetical protein